VSARAVSSDSSTLSGKLRVRPVGYEMGNRVSPESLNGMSGVGTGKMFMFRLGRRRAEDCILEAALFLVALLITDSSSVSVLIT